MRETLGSIYFDSELSAEIIYSIIEILEEHNLTDRLEFDIVGPIEEFEKKADQIRFVKVDDRLSWIRNKLSRDERISFHTQSADAPLPIAYFSTQFAGFNRERTKKCECIKFVIKPDFDPISLFSGIDKITALKKVYWGDCTPWSVLGHIVKQIVRPHEKDRKPDYGLPIVKVPQFLSGPEIPFFFGWINYWSEETISIIDFDLMRDAGLFYKVEMTTTKGAVLQLTEEPLNLDIPEHLDALKKAYERFPKVGGRDTPFEYLKQTILLSNSM